MFADSTKTLKRGFTLLELLVVLAIIGVLSSTAIVMFRENKFRSMRSEAMTNLGAIGNLERGYYGEHGIFHGALPSPQSGIPGQKENWDATARAQFDGLGFATEGVFYSYDVNTATMGCACASCFTAAAWGDSDRDGNMGLVGLYHDDGAGGFCPSLIGGYGPPIHPDGTPIFDAPVDYYRSYVAAGLPSPVDDF
jgi:prepilin-type N-terminal cleavage/methylation domain-containing protein